MKIERSQVTKILITDVPRLDPISVIAEDIEPGKGKITVTCFDKSWTAYWGGMGEGADLAKFFRRVDACYVANCLCRGMESNIPDMDAFKDQAVRLVLTERRQRNLSACEARGRYDDIDRRFPSEMSAAWRSNLVAQIFGDEWWYQVPTKPNPEWTYLCCVVQAVLDAFAQLREESAVAA